MADIDVKRHGLDAEEQEKDYKKEKRRLLKLFESLPESEKKLLDGMISEAARLRVQLDWHWADRKENGDIEKFSQSKDAKPYDRERPSVRIYNTRTKNYQVIIKTLVDRLPDGKASVPVGEDALRFAMGGPRGGSKK